MRINRIPWLVGALAVALAFTGPVQAQTLAFDLTVQEFQADGTTLVGQNDRVNDGLTTALPPASGDTVKVELFVVGATGVTQGGTFTFADDGNAFTDNFAIAIGAGGFPQPFPWNGFDPALNDVGITTVTSISQLPDGNSFRAGPPPNFTIVGFAPVPIGTGGYLATLYLVASRDIPEGTTLALQGEWAEGMLGITNIPATGASVTFATPAGPVVTPDQAGPLTIPRDGNVTVVLTASNFDAAAVITWNVTSTSGVTVAEALSADGTTNTLTVSGGDGTVTATASDGATTTDAVTVVLAQQVPAELATFGGEIVENTVALNWTTLSQTNNAGWRVLRSEDGVAFVPVSELIPGMGTTDALLNYGFTDEEVPAVETVFYRLEQIDLDGAVHLTSPIEVVLGARFLDLPDDFAMNVYPNPFNPSTTISYDLPSESTVSIVIFDALGQEVRRLVSETRAAGRYTIQWDARDNLGRGVASGVFIAKVEAGQFSGTQKMLLLK